MPFLCRACRYQDCEIWLDFGPQPNSSDMPKSPSGNWRKHPLKLANCPRCGLIFIPQALPPDDFYLDAQLATSFNPAPHMNELVNEFRSSLKSGPSSSIFEIGCNDGYFLALLQSAGFHDLRGIDPAPSCSESARKNGFNILTGYFGLSIAQRLHESGYSPQLIVCRHVLEHVQDLADFLSGIDMLLPDDGELLLEVPDMETIGSRGDFSAIWDQHVNYFDLASVEYLLAGSGLGIRSSRRIPHGGGTLILLIGRSDSRPCTRLIPSRDAWKLAIADNISMTRETVRHIRSEGRTIAAFGAGMRGTMLINLSAIGEFLEFVVDDNPEKVGRFLPGSGLPVVSMSSMAGNRPDVCFILPLSNKATERRVMRRMDWFAASGGYFLEFLPEDGGVLSRCTSMQIG
jgi:SAM-dependent methyltransferase